MFLDFISYIASPSILIIWVSFILIKKIFSVEIFTFEIKVIFREHLWRHIP